MKTYIKVKEHYANVCLLCGTTAKSWLVQYKFISTSTYLFPTFLHNSPDQLSPRCLVIHAFLYWKNYVGKFAMGVDSGKSLMYITMRIV